MQTSTWMPVPASAQRPGWLKVIGWYAAGSCMTVASWAAIGSLAWVTSRAVVSLLAQVSFVGGIVALVYFGRRLPRRSRIALWLGVVSPFLLVGAAIAYVLYSLAHSNFTF